MIGKYLDARNTMSMVEALNNVEQETTELELELAKDHDSIGWQNFTEGRISKLYLEYQRRYYKTLKDCRRHATTWAVGLIENIFKLVHNQWTWRNEKLHFRRHPGAETAFEYERTMERIVNQLEMTDPEDLLPEDLYLLDVDPEDLAKSTRDGRQSWQTNLETALIAAEHEKQKRESDMDDENEELQSSHFKSPEENKRCVIRAGKRWRQHIRQKRILKWKKYNFLGQKHNLGELDDEKANDNTPPTKGSQQICTRKQSNLNSWLISEGSQRYKRRQKK